MRDRERADPRRLVAYAESVYGNYEAATSGRIELDVVTLQTGNLSDVASVDVGELLGVPGTWIRMEQRGTEITAVQREPRDPEQDEWRQQIDLRAFEDMGRPLAEGTYRLLAVTARLDDAPATHRPPAQASMTARRPWLLGRQAPVTRSCDGTDSRPARPRPCRWARCPSGARPASRA